MRRGAVVFALFCLVLTACADAACDLDGDCQLTCEGDRDCPLGERCESQVCSALCDDALCKSQLGRRAECRGGPRGSCEVVTGCGRTVSCLEPTDLCDRTSSGCFPVSGECSDAADCPLMFEDAAAFGLACEAGYCRFPELGPLVLADDYGGVSILEPAAGTKLSSASELTLRVSGPPGVYVCVITATRPGRLRDLRNAALWIATLRDPDVVRLTDGVMPGEAGASSPGLPGDQPLFLTVAVYDPAHRIATSPVIPFTLGSAWKEPGADCDDPLSVPGSCIHPARLQACSARRECAIVCASDRDCPDHLTSGICDKGIDGVKAPRLCILR